MHSSCKQVQMKIHCFHQNSIKKYATSLEISNTVLALCLNSIGKYCSVNQAEDQQLCCEKKKHCPLKINLFLLCIALRTAELKTDSEANTTTELVRVGQAMQPHCREQPGPEKHVTGSALIPGVGAYSSSSDSNSDSSDSEIEVPLTTPRLYREAYMWIKQEKAGFSACALSCQAAVSSNRSWGQIRGLLIHVDNEAYFQWLLKQGLCRENMTHETKNVLLYSETK